MKKQNEALFELIKSLSPSEKGYFLKYSSALPGKTGVRYLELFRILDGMKAFDEAAFEKRLARADFSKQVHRVRNYLYHSLLQTLVQYQKDITQTDKILTLLRQAFVLSERKLHKQSNDILERAEKLAKEIGKHNLNYEILRLRLKNQYSTYQAMDSGETMKIVEELTAAAASHHYSTEAYRAYTVFADIYYKHGQASDEAKLEEYNRLFSGLLDHVDYDKLDDWGRVNYHQAEFMYYLAKGDIDGVIKALEDAARLLKRNLKHLENKKIFTSVTYNLLLFYMEKRRFDDVERELNELEFILKEYEQHLTVDMLDDFWVTIHMHWFNLLVKDHRRRHDRGLFEKIKGFFEKRPKELAIRHDFRFHFNLMAYYLYNKLDKEALGQVNHLLNGKKYKEINVGVQAEAELVNLFIHTRLAHTDLLESMLLNLRRKVRGEEEIHFQGLIELILKCFGRYPSLKNSPEKREWKKELVESLKGFEEQNPEIVAPLDFDYSWYFENVF